MLSAREQLCHCCLSADFQPITSRGIGPELQQAPGFWSQAAVHIAEESKLQTEDFEVSSVAVIFTCLGAS